MKEGEAVKKEDLRHLLYFCGKKKLKEGVVIYSGNEKIDVEGGVSIHYLLFGN